MHPSFKETNDVLELRFLGENIDIPLDKYQIAVLTRNDSRMHFQKELEHWICSKLLWSTRRVNQGQTKVILTGSAETVSERNELTHRDRCGVVGRCPSNPQVLSQRHEPRVAFWVHGRLNCNPWQGKVVSDERTHD